jgi:DNA-binding transcriptional ArsR family regulator
VLEIGHADKDIKHMAQQLMNSEEDIMQAALAMKAIAHPLRLKILCVLANGELSVQDIVEQVGTSQSNISQHLSILRDKAVLYTRKDANRVYYRIGDPRIIKLVGMMRDVFCPL